LNEKFEQKPNQPDPSCKKEKHEITSLQLKAADCLKNNCQSIIDKNGYRPDNLTLFFKSQLAKCHSELVTAIIGNK